MEWLPSQVAAVNPLFVLALVPLFNGFTLPWAGWCRMGDRPRVHLRETGTWRWVAFGGLYALLEKRVRVTPMRKLGCGLFVMVLAFSITLQIEVWIDDGHTPSIGWQLLAYFVLTTAEVLVSVTALEFSYTQAPRKMKSVVMALYLLSTSMGNLLTFLVRRARASRCPAATLCCLPRCDECSRSCASVVCR